MMMSSRLNSLENFGMGNKQINREFVDFKLTASILPGVGVQVRYLEV